MQADAHTFAVEQLRLGDHAGAHYGDDNARWQLPAWHSPGEAHLAGDGDVSTRERFRDVIRCSGLPARTLRHLGAARVGRLVLDELAEDR